MKRFDLVWVNLDPTIGREIRKTRPCAIVSPDELNEHLDTVIVVPLTGTVKLWPFRMTIEIDGKRSSMAFDQLRTVSKERIGRKAGHLTPKQQEQAIDILQQMFAA